MKYKVPAAVLCVLHIISCSSTDEYAEIKLFHFNNANRYYASAQYASALEHFMKFLEYDKTNVDVVLVAAICAREAGIELYQKTYDFIKAGNEKHAAANLKQANDLHSLSYTLFSKALELLPKARGKFNTNRSTICYELGQFYYLRAMSPIPVPLPFNSEERRKEKDSAIELFRKAISLDKGVIRTYKLLGTLLLDRQDLESRKEGALMLTSYLEQRAREKELLWDKMDIKNPRIMEMKKQELSLIEQDTLKTADLLIIEGLKISEELYSKGRYKEQSEFLRQLVAHDPSNFKIKTELAIINSEIAMRDNDAVLLRESIDMFREALAINPDYHKAHKYIGLSYQHLGLKLPAKEHLEKYIDLLDTIISKLRLGGTDDGRKEAARLQSDKEKVQEIIKTL